MRSDGVPWGRAPVPDIPVPPFADAEAHRRFQLALAEYCASLADTRGGIDIGTYALLSVLHDSTTSIRYSPGVESGPRELAPLVLRIAVASYFPAPWTPWSLVEACNAARLDPNLKWTTDSRGLGYSYDPSFWARRDFNGSWTAYFSERGVERVDAHLDNDDDMVLYLMDHVRGHPYPFGWRADDDRLAALDAPATRAIEAWRRHAELPYIADWRR